METVELKLRPNSGGDTWDDTKVGELFFGMQNYVGVEQDGWLCISHTKIHYTDKIPSRQYLTSIITQVEDGLLKDVTLTLVFDKNLYEEDGASKRNLEAYFQIVDIDIPASNYPEIEYDKTNYEHLGNFGDF